MTLHSNLSLIANSFGFSDTKNCLKAMRYGNLCQASSYLANATGKFSGLSDLQTAHDLLWDGRYVSALKSALIGTGKLALIGTLVHSIKQLYYSGYQEDGREFNQHIYLKKENIKGTYTINNKTFEFNELGFHPYSENKRSPLPANYRFFSSLGEIEGRIVIANSGQFSQKQFDTFKSTAQKQWGSDVKIIVVDTRAENHLFCDGHPIVDLNPKTGMSTQDILNKEFSLKEKINNNTLSFDLKDQKNAGPITCSKAEIEYNIINASNEKNSPIKYVRIPINENSSDQGTATTSLHSFFDEIKKNDFGPRKVILIHGKTGNNEKGIELANGAAQQVFQSCNLEKTLDTCPNINYIKNSTNSTYDLTKKL